MVFFNYTTMQMTAKIVYYGPGLCGKTTNLHYIHHKTDPDSRGEMVSLETEADRTLFFDLLPLEVGVIGGMRVRLQLYTVPGQVFYNTTRKLVLKGVDGVVFVADSQVPALDANLESFENLQQNLKEMNQSLDQIPFVFQFNKRDLRNIHSVELINRTLNPSGYEVFEAAALHGVGVFETLKAISKKTLASVHRKVSGKEPRRERALVPEVSVLAEPALTAAAVPEAAALPPDPVERSLLERDTEEVKVEFAASLDVTPSSTRIEPASEVRKIATKSRLDIERELDNLRKLARRSAPGAASRRGASAGPLPARRSAGLRVEAADGGGPAASREKDLKASPASGLAGEGTLTRVIKLKLPRAILEVTKRLALDLRLAGGGTHHGVPDVLDLELPERGASQRVRLEITLELEGEDG